jgi:hypothetical protein
MIQPDTENKLKSVINASKLISRMKKASPGTSRSELIYFDMLEKYYTRLMNAKRDGKFIAAHTVFFPTEIFYAMDIVPMHTESSTCIWALYTGRCAELLACGAEMGMASEI